MSALKSIPLTLGLFAAAASADTTIDATSNFDWGANTGWMNFAGNTTHGVVVGGSHLSGYAWAANTGWIHFGDGAPTNGYAYANDATGDFGVNHDGAGNLSGYAYAANTGWVNFGWASPSDPSRPRFDLQTGDFAGFAYSANTGWINLGSGLLATDLISSPDTDNDGIADHWEMLHFDDLVTAGLNTHADGDGNSDAAEYAANTDPNNAAEYLKIVSQSYNGNLTEVTLQFAGTSPARLYRIEYSDDLGGADPWTDSSLGVFAPDSGSSTTKLIAFPGHPKKFFRVVANVPQISP